MKFERTFDILAYLKDNKEKQGVFYFKENKKWEAYSGKDYYENALYFALGLLHLGFQKGDTIATISNNRPEWNFVDMGMALVGVIHVPIYPTNSREEIIHILHHSEAKMVIVSDKALYKKIKPICETVPTVKNLFTFNLIDEASHWSSVKQNGFYNHDRLIDKYKEINNSITKDDVCSIIYTSGTTGLAKGVMLTHENFMSNMNGVWDRFPLDKDSRTLSFLPLCHVFERMVNYLFQAKLCSIYYAESLGTIASDLKEIKATAFVTVPRVIERIYDKIVSKAQDLNGIQKSIFDWSLRMGENYCSKNNNSALYNIQLNIARKLVFSKWQKAFGGELDFVISGGAALQPRLSKVFFAAGISLMEGYGLTETAPVIAANYILKPNNLLIGTVGPVLDNLEVKIVEDGEILVKGPSVMKGYYKQPGLTAEVIDKDGWFHTGDIGQLIDNKFLKITDRKKEIFKTSAGKYVAPQPIENLLKESIFIEQSMVVGESEKFASALISPNFDYLHTWAHDNKIHFRDNKELVKMSEVKNLFQKEVNNVNKQLGQHEQIKRFKIVVEPWAPGSGELSATLKLKRRVLYRKYAKELRKIYAYDSNEENKGSISFF